jgi:hypothetical protein
MASIRKSVCRTALQDIDVAVGRRTPSVAPPRRDRPHFPAFDGEAGEDAILAGHVFTDFREVAPARYRNGRPIETRISAGMAGAVLHLPAKIEAAT